jgi:hypothetical protein
LIERLSEIYPNAEFKLQYAEPSMDFAGMVKWKNGVVIHSDEDPTGEIMKEMVGGEPEEDEE